MEKTRFLSLIDYISCSVAVLTNMNGSKVPSYLHHMSLMVDCTRIPRNFVKMQNMKLNCALRSHSRMKMNNLCMKMCRAEC